MLDGVHGKARDSRHLNGSTYTATCAVAAPPPFPMTPPSIVALRHAAQLARYPFAESSFQVAITSISRTISRGGGRGSFFGGCPLRAHRSPKIRQPYPWHFTVDDVDRPSTVVESCPFRLQRNGRLGRSWTPRLFSRNACHTVSLDGLDDLDG